MRAIKSCYFYFSSYLVFSWCLILLCSFFERADGFLWNEDTFRRKVSLELNPGLTPPLKASPGVSLLHVRALGENDTLHFMVCSGGAPTLLTVHTNSTNSSLSVDWQSYLGSNISGSVQIEPASSVQYSSALVLTRLLEFDDVNSTEEIELSPYELQNFMWDDLNGKVDYSHYTATLCGTHSDFSTNGSLCLHFSAFESEGREAVWPSLRHSANSSQLRVWLNDIKPRTNNSRFGLELQTVMETEFQSRVAVEKSIDDEYTPSIFQVSKWEWSGDNFSSVVGFSQWKPVAYRSRLPTIEDASPCSNSAPVLNPQVPPSRIVTAFFTHNPLTHSLNISFHNADESNSDSTHFISWTLLAGIGIPPSDFFSPLVIAIMTIGLGTPLLLLAVGGVYICIHKRKHDKRGSYQPIN